MDDLINSIAMVAVTAAWLWLGVLNSAEKDIERLRVRANAVNLSWLIASTLWILEGGLQHLMK